MIKQMKVLTAKRARGDQGFTLIELLVVIVILGIIASVVVFAVGGIDDKGEVASFQTDAQTLRTAQEAWCAQEGEYLSEADLVSEGMLASESSLNDIVVRDVPEGCGGKEFAITCAPNQAGCGQNGTTPDGAFAGGDGSTPTGAWTRAGDLPVPALLGGEDDLVTMSNGKALFFAKRLRVIPSAPGAYTPLTMVYDPSSGEWSETDPMPGPSPRNPLAPGPFRTTMLPLEGSPSECGELCGKVLVLAHVVDSFGPEYLNMRAFVFDPAAHDGGDEPWTSVDPPSDPSGLILGNVVSASPVQLACSRTDNPGSDCGKVLVPTAPDSRAAARGYTSPPADNHRAALFDPVDATWALAPAPIAGVNQRLAGSVVLSDGRALFSGLDVDEIYDPVAKTWTPPANSTQTLGGVCRALGGNGTLLRGGTRALFLETGECGTPGNDALTFDGTTNTWTSVAGCPCVPGFIDPPEKFVLPASHGSLVVVVTNGEYPNRPGQKSSALFDPDPSNPSPWTLVEPTFSPARNVDRGNEVGTNGRLAATLLPSGQVLIAGGTVRPVGGNVASITGMTDTWLYTPPLVAP